MRRSSFLFALLLSTQAHPATPRCGTDDFGNAVCMDKDGVVSVAPRSEQAASNAASPRADEGVNSRGSQGSQRCATDSFGNTVCSEHFKPRQEK